MAGATRSGWSHLVLAVLVAHLLLGAARLATRTTPRRHADIARFTAAGAPRHHLDTPHVRGADAIERLLAATPPDAIVLWRGEWRGAMEFVPGLLWPRLVVQADALPDDATSYLGRPLACPPGEPGAAPWLLVGHRDHLELTRR